MILEVTTKPPIPFGTLVSLGASETAQYVMEQSHVGLRRLRESSAFGLLANSAVEELYRVYLDCVDSDWDGYKALPVSEVTYRAAYRLLDALPLGTPIPSFGAEPDGHLTLEWHRSPRRTLSVSVSPEGELHYAALVGASKAYGTEPFFGDVPNTILDLIDRVMAV
jgi:hypothetical protein